VFDAFGRENRQPVISTVRVLMKYFVCLCLRTLVRCVDVHVRALCLRLCACVRLCARVIFDVQFPRVCCGLKLS